MRAGSKQLIREINQTIVLNAIRTHGALSRTDIAGISKLSLAAISGITAELIDLGFVYEHQVGVSTGGRPPVLLALNNQAGYVVGVKLTEDAVIVALTDLEATIVASRTVASLPARIAAAVYGPPVDRFGPTARPMSSNAWQVLQRFTLLNASKNAVFPFEASAGICFPAPAPAAVRFTFDASPPEILTT